MSNRITESDIIAGDMKDPIQPSAKNHYLSANYEDFTLWVDYWYQKQFLEETKPKKILEVGKGTGTLEKLMEVNGFNYTTVDIDIKLNPDFVGNIVKLPFKDKSYDTVCAFEVLEHIPFSKFSISLKEMARVSKKSIVISIPYACFYFGFAFQMFYMKAFDKFFKFFKMKPFEPVYFNLSIPFFFLTNKGMIKAHAWEMGRKGYPVSRIRSVIKQCGLKIIKEESRMFYPYHRFFILKK